MVHTNNMTVSEHIRCEVEALNNLFISHYMGSAFGQINELMKQGNDAKTNRPQLANWLIENVYNH